MSGDNTNPQGAKFYYADGRKVPLTTSTRYMAVKAAPQAGPESLEGKRVASALSGYTSAANVIGVPKYNLAVIEVPGPAAQTNLTGPSAPLAAVHSFVSAQTELTSGPVVYEVPDEPTREALIPVGEILVQFKPEVKEEARRRLLEQNNLEIRQSDYPEEGTLLVTTKAAQDPIAVANKLHESELVEYAQPNFVRLTPRQAIVGEDENPGLSLETNGSSAFRGKAARPFVETRELDDSQVQPGILIAPLAPPTDPGFSSQWGLVKIKAVEAFGISMGDPNITVAVIDEGADITHEDINFSLPGYDAVDGDNNQQPNSGDGHGTSCSGIIAMKANNGKGGVGVAPNCRVMPVRIAYGANGRWVTSDAQIADGINKAVLRKADVLSNSWGGGAPSTVITNAFKNAQTNGRSGKGCPIAIATGNDDLGVVNYPANLSPTIPGLLAVGGSNQWDQRKTKTSLDGETWWGSNYGPEVDVVAPCVKIFTADMMGTAGYNSGNYIPNFNGTSSATPHVAGLMALILSVDPGLRSWEVEDIIKLSADNLGAPGRDVEYGFGRINSYHALQAASRLWCEVSVVPEFLGSGQECYIRMNVRMYNSGINSVRLDSLAITSQNSTGIVDRLDYRGNPGGIMAPRSTNDVTLNHVLLKANGNSRSWSYNWALNWSYTYWRPTSPGFPLNAVETALDPAAGIKATSISVRGSASKAQAGNSSSQPSAGDYRSLSLPTPGEPSTFNGNSLVVTRPNEPITIIIR